MQIGIEVLSQLTSIDSSNQGPIPRMNDRSVEVPAFAPLHAVSPWLSLQLRPKAEVEGRDEEDPIQACGRR